MVITVAIVEEYKLLVDALAYVLGLEDGLEFVGGAPSYAAGLDLVSRIRPDILLVDINLLEGSGLEFIRKVREITPATQLVIFSGILDKETVLQAVDSGVTGFLSKNSSLPDLISTIRKAAQGEMVMPPSLLVGLLKKVQRMQKQAEQNFRIWDNLTPREHQILAHLAAGKSNQEIAVNFNIAPLTVRTHVRNLIYKLGVHSRLEAVAFGYKHGLIEPPKEAAAQD